MGRNRELEFLLDSVSNRWGIFNSESNEWEYMVEGELVYGANVIVISRKSDYVLYATSLKQEERGEDWEIPGSRKVVPDLDGVAKYLEEWLDRIPGRDEE